MAAIHEISNPVLTSTLDLFSVVDTNTQITRSWHQAYNPITPIDKHSGGENGVFEFLVHGSPEIYVNLSETYLYLLVSIKNNNGDYIKATDEVGPVTNLFHSMFSQIDVSVNDHMITTPTHTNPYKGFIENICNYGHDSANSKLLCQLNIKDTPGKIDSLFTVTDDKGVQSENKGLMDRRAYFLKHKNVELIGKPLFNLSCQQKLILDNTKIKFSFTRQKDSFCLMHERSKSYHLFVEEAALYVCKASVDPLTALAHHKVLNDGSSIKYPSRTGVVKHFTVASGLNNAIRENVSNSQHPTKLFVWFTSAAAASGASNLNPFNLHHYDVSFFAAYLDGVQYPFKELRPNFEDGKYLRSYFHLLSTSGCDFNSDVGLPITREDFINGYTIFAVDFTPNAGVEEAFHLIRRGSLRLEILFNKPLPEPINVFFYCEYETLVELRADGTVKTTNIV
jgi:hypothetical protein